MRVLHAISSAGIYGAEAVILTLCKAQNRHQPGSALLACFNNTAQPNLALHEAALAAGIESHLVEARGRVDLSTASSLRNLAARLQVDVLHTHGYKADIYGYFATRDGGVPVVSTCHNWCDTDLQTRVYGWLDRRVLRSFHAIAVVSAEVQQRLAASGIPAHLVRLVRNGIDTRPFVFDGDRHAQPLTVGFAGRLSSEKGIDLFLEAAEAILREQPETRFLIAGDGAERQAAERTIAEKQMGEHVRLLGRRDDMPQVYRQFDLLLSTSRTEGLPIGLMEAMAGGVPVVATAVGDVPKLIQDGVSGLLVPPLDVTAMANAALRMMRDEELRGRLGQGGAAKVSQEFSDEQMMRAYLLMYEDVLLPGRNGARA